MPEFLVVTAIASFGLGYWVAIKNLEAKGPKSNSG